MKYRIISLSFVMLISCWGIKMDNYMVLSNYKANKPVIIDLNTGFKYTLNNKLFRRKNFQFFKMIKIYPQKDKMILLWTKTDYDYAYRNYNSLIEIYSISKKIILKKIKRREYIHWVAIKNDSIFYTTIDKIKSMKQIFSNNISKINNIIYKINADGGYIWQVCLNDDLIFFITIYGVKYKLTVMNVYSKKIVKKIEGVIYIEKYKNKIYLIKQKKNINEKHSAFKKYSVFIYNQYNQISEFTKIVFKNNLYQKDIAILPLKKSLFFYSSEYNDNACVTLSTLFTKKGPRIQYVIHDVNFKKIQNLGHVQRQGTGSLYLQIIPRMKEFKSFLIHY